MKKSTLLAALAFLVIFGLSAQTQPARFEIGLQFNGLNFSGTQFASVVKIQKSENVYRRIRFVFGQINALINRGSDRFIFDATISFGKEKRKYVRKKTMLYHGLNYHLGIDFTTVNELKPFVRIQPGLGYILGIQHDFNEYFAINLEIIPDAYASFSTQSGFHNFNAGAGFSSAPNLGLMYRF
jgi:hypothetical protein